MPTLAEIRQQYPQYQDLSDEQLAKGLHQKFYSDLPFDDFASKIGYQVSRVYDPFASDASSLPPLPGENVTEAASLPVQQQPSYMDRLKQAAGAPGDSNPLKQLYGLAETGTTLATGAVAPAIASGKGILTGQQPTNADIAKFVYEPRTNTGKALTGIIGTALEPVGVLAEQSGADAALLPLAAELQTIQRLPRAQGAKRVPPPTKEALRAATDDAYKAAREAGVAYKPDALNTIRNRVEAAMQREGFDKDLHPDTAAVLRRLREQSEAGKPLSLEEVENLRRVALNAEGALKPQDRRLASILVDTFDDATEGFGVGDTIAGDSAQAQAILRQARDYHTRVKKSDEIDALVRRAELSAPNFSASGMENALRTEFRALAKNDKRMRRFSPEERQAIERVAKGDLPTNALRMLGKFAPTGVVSAGLSSGAGFVVGGPVGATALPLAGLASRAGASALTKRNVQRAADLVRGGPINPLPAATPQAAPVAATGQVMPRPTLALPAPNIVASARSAPGTAFAREQMGLTPDIERAGALHPGMARELAMPRAPEGPAALPHRPAPGLLADERPMIVDADGRVAPNREQLRAYLHETGQENMRNVRQPRADTPRRGILAEKHPAEEVQDLVAEARSLKLFEDENPSAAKRAKETSWLKDYNAAKARLKAYESENADRD